MFVILFLFSDGVAQVEGVEEVTVPGGRPYLSFTGIPYAKPPTGARRWPYPGERKT